MPIGKDPEVICSSPEYKELKWIAGEFYWMESVQPYNEGGWDYTTELRKFVQGGMTGNSFINGVSGIVNRGCHNPVSADNAHIICLAYVHYQPFASDIIICVKFPFLHSHVALVH